jgi:hypothetical protein
VGIIKNAAIEKAPQTMAGKYFDANLRDKIALTTAIELTIAALMPPNKKI